MFRLRSFRPEEVKVLHAFAGVVIEGLGVRPISAVWNPEDERRMTHFETGIGQCRISKESVGSVDGTVAPVDMAADNENRFDPLHCGKKSTAARMALGTRKLIEHAECRTVIDDYVGVYGNSRIDFDAIEKGAFAERSTVERRHRRSPDAQPLNLDTLVNEHDGVANQFAP